MIPVKSKMNHIVVVDHPVLAESIALLLQQRLNVEVTATTSDPGTLTPLNALVLLELSLPEQQHGLLIARQLLQARPDLTCVVWSCQPALLHIWASLEWKVNGCLDKAMPVEDLMYWLNMALRHGAAWPGSLLTQARAWEQEAASSLRALTPSLWQLWGELLRGGSNVELVVNLGWAERTVGRRLVELYESLRVQCRTEAVNLAWKWGLVRGRTTGAEWSRIVQELFPSAKATV